MIIYDFDKTIYPGDCSIHFWKFCVKQHPSILRYAPGTMFSVIRYGLHRCTWDKVTENFFRFIRVLPSLEDTVDAFWKKNLEKVQDWFLRQREKDDLVISAAPRFLVEDACRRLGIRCLATELDPATGKIQGSSCSGKEKVSRFRMAFGERRVEAFYSDSLIDQPMAEYAGNAFLVNRGRIEKWPFTQKA